MDDKGEKAFSINDYKGKFLVIVFYRGDWECQEYLQAFSDLQSKFSSVKAEVVGCSTDSTKVHQCWIKTDRWAYSLKLIYMNFLIRWNLKDNKIKT